MAQNNQRERALEVIRENIARSGHHTYVVSAGGQTPRFAYTIGVELILAGAIFHMKDDVVTIINETLAKMKAQPDCEVFEVDGQGSFTLREVHSSWAQELKA